MIFARACFLLPAFLFASVSLADGVKVGDQAPDVTAKDQDGKDVSIGSFKGKKAVILWFYPKAMTPGCTKEGCALRDDMEKFEKLDVQIIGVSMDQVADQKKFADKEGFKYPLLADHEGKVCEAFGVAKNMRKTKDGKELTLANRSTIVIGKDGKVLYVNHKVDIPKQNAELLELLGKK